MGKFNVDPPEPRLSYSHARIKPVVVEKMSGRRALLCPVCGTKMKLVRKPKLTGTCPRCEPGQA